jgi:hypothetical protein
MHHVNPGSLLASSPTLSRPETRTDVMALNRVLIEQFIAAHQDAPTEWVLDADASDFPLHGDQERAQFLRAVAAPRKPRQALHGLHQLVKHSVGFGHTVELGDVIMDRLQVLLSTFGEQDLELG